MKKSILNKGFTLVELLVVITILAIMSVVAYQSFGGVTDKAYNSTKIKNMTILGGKLQEFYTSENYYPMPQSKSDSNRWGYDDSIEANPSNYIRVEYNEAEIDSLTGALNDYTGGGIIYGTGSWASSGADPKQIGAKGVLGVQGAFNKKWLKKPIYDNQVGDIDLTGEGKKMIDYGIGKFVYAVYARPAGTSNWNVSGNRGTYFELAATLKVENGEGYKTRIEGDYSNDNFSGTDKDKYPVSLIGLTDGSIDDANQTTTSDNQGIPYALDNFAK